MIYFTADTHFYHSNVIQYEQRPFQTMEEMDEALIRNWNARVSPEDDIYILGDFTLKGPVLANALLERLQGCNAAAVSLSPTQKAKIERIPAHPPGRYAFLLM